MVIDHDKFMIYPTFDQDTYMNSQQVRYLLRSSWEPTSSHFFGGWGKHHLAPINMVMLVKQCQKPAPNSPKTGGMLTIPSHGWFIIVLSTLNQITNHTQLREVGETAPRHSLSGPPRYHFAHAPQSVSPAMKLIYALVVEHSNGQSTVYDNL